MTDFEFEFQQALTNKKLNAELETMFVITDPQYMYLSSSMVKQVAQLWRRRDRFPAGRHL
ncbi:MAG: hypothetical protein V8T36_03045 [Ruthenibacterium lactatiformans]